MVKDFLHRLKESIRPRALILMYHRIASPESDVWDIAVSPAHFEQQLEVLKKTGRVISLKELAQSLQNRRLKPGSIAITFDDGYLDNYEVAKPLLEKWGLPATFFITSGNIGQDKEFWWDELEQLMLYTQSLPREMNIKFGDTQVSANLAEEAQLSETLRLKHRQWHASEQEPPTRRAALYWQLWQMVQLMPHASQQQALGQLRSWANQPVNVRGDFKSMNREQLKQLAASALFDIGIHTVTHPALAFHSPEFQRREIWDNKQFLEEILGKKMELMAYPFGNHNDASVALAQEAGLLATVTTKEQVVMKSSPLYRLGRFQVKNWNGTIFQQQLNNFTRGKK